MPTTPPQRPGQTASGRSALLQPLCCQLPVLSMYFPLRRNPRTAWARPSGAVRTLTKSRPLPAGPSERRTSNAGDGTLYRSHHSACWSCQDAGAISARPRTTPGRLHVRRLTLQCGTVYFLQYSATARPRLGEDDDFSLPPVHGHHPSLCL